MRLICCVTALILCLVWDCPIVSSAVAGEPRQLVEVDRVHLSVEPPGIIVKSIATSDDGRHIAFGRKSDAGICVVRDGKDGDFFEDVAGIKFSPDGKHLAHLAKAKGKAYVVLDGALGQEYEAVDFCKWSPASDRVVLVARQGRDYVVVLQDFRAVVKGDAYRRLESEPVFGPDGRRIAYIVERDGKRVVVLDGEEGPPFWKVSLIVFSPDGGRCGYVGWPSADAKKGVLVVDGKTRTEAEVTTTSGVSFSSDGKRWCYSVVRGERQVPVVQDDQGRIEGFARKYVFNPSFMPNNTDLLYSALDEGSFFVVSGKQESLRHKDGVAVLPMLSSDGSHLSYIVEGLDGQRVVVDRREERRFDRIPPIGRAFTSDGKKFAYVSKTADEYRVLLCSQEGTQEFGPYKAAGIPIFGPQDDHFGFVFNRSGRLGVAIDGIEATGVIVSHQVVFDGPNAVRVITLDDKAFYSICLGLPKG